MMPILAKQQSSARRTPMQSGAAASDSPALHVVVHGTMCCEAWGAHGNLGSRRRAGAAAASRLAGGQGDVKTAHARGSPPRDTGDIDNLWRGPRAARRNIR